MGGDLSLVELDAFTIYREHPKLALFCWHHLATSYHMRDQLRRAKYSPFVKALQIVRVAANAPRHVPAFARDLAKECEKMRDDELEAFITYVVRHAEKCVALD